MEKKFAERIYQMNKMYRLPIHQTPNIPNDAVDRLKKFKLILIEEIGEIDEVVELASKGGAKIDVAVALADLLGDIIVYCRSEALKYGLPLEEILNVIMDSNESKLGADGQPIYDENGKFLKGPSYWRPEKKIKELLEKKMV